MLLSDNGALLLVLTVSPYRYEAFCIIVIIYIDVSLCLLILKGTKGWNFNLLMDFISDP